MATPLRRILALTVLLSLTGSIAACGERNETMKNSDASVEATGKTSRESYDAFMAKMNELVALTGEPNGWTADFGKPWPLEPGTEILPEVCDTLNPEDSPRRIKLQVAGPGTEDLQADRDAMIRYLESQGMTITRVFGDPSYPHGVAWEAYSVGDNGLQIDYAVTPEVRSIVMSGECSTHPSMQDKVSQDTP